MKKIYNIFFYFNILCGLILLIAYNFVINYSDLSIVTTMLAVIFYLFAIIKYIKNKNDVRKIDFLATGLYILFIIFMIIFSIAHQSNNSIVFSLIYFAKYLILPHIVIILYNITKVHQED